MRNEMLARLVSENRERIFGNAWAASAEEGVGLLGGKCEALEAIAVELANQDSALHAPTLVRLLVACGADAVPVLLEQLNAEDKNTRYGAVESLKELNHPASATGLVAALSDPYIREEAAEALGRIGAPGVAAMSKALAHSDALVRRGAVTALCYVEAKVAVPPLVYAASDRDLPVRIEAAYGLGRHPGKPAVQCLLRALKDDAAGLREAAASSLGSIGDASAIDALAHALKDQNGDVRVEAAEALGDIGDARSVEFLQEAEKDAGEEVRQAAREALEKIKKAQEEKKSEKQPGEAPAK